MRPIYDHSVILLPDMNSSRKYFLAYFAACLAAILLYLPGLGGPFLFDDHGNIVNNPAVHIASLSWAALSDSLSGPAAGPLGRPISVISFALTYYAFGLDPFAFKAINLSIHLLNGLLVYFLLRLLLTHSLSSLSETARKWLPLWVTTVWVLHPINVTPVLMTVQRMTLLAGCFTLLALICHSKGLLSDAPRKRAAWLLLGWGFAWPLAVLSKETAILFPLYALLMSWALANKTRGSGLRWSTLLGVTATTTCALAFMLYLGSGWLERGYEMRSFTLYERVLTEARVLWLYAMQILLPSYSKFGLHLDDIHISRSLIDPVTTAIAIAGWLSVLLVCALLLRKHRLISLSILWFLVGHSLESTILPLEIAHEYRNYLPALGLLTASAMGAVLAIQWLGKQQARRTLTVALAALALAVVSAYTGMRSLQYRDEIGWLQMEVSYHPNSPRANYELAAALMKNGYGAQGDPLGDLLVQYHFLQAGKLDPSFKLGYLGVIVWACASERPLDRQWLDDFEQRLGNTPFGPKDRGLAADILPPLIAHNSCIDRQQAMRLFIAGSTNPEIGDDIRASFLVMAADYELLAHSDPDSAIQLLQQATRLAPDKKELRAKLDSLKLARERTQGSSED